MFLGLFRIALLDEGRSEASVGEGIIFLDAEGVLKQRDAVFPIPNLDMAQDGKNDHGACAGRTRRPFCTTDVTI